MRPETGHRIGNRLITAGEASLPIFNPATGEQIGQCPIAGADIVSQAVDSASAAFPAALFGTLWASKVAVPLNFLPNGVGNQQLEVIGEQSERTKLVVLDAEGLFSPSHAGPTPRLHA